jgi:ssDNA-binding Zn-finger/Zn-ribbon topoisomerase 1
MPKKSAAPSATAMQKARVARLAAISPTAQQYNLVCADCGAHMMLQLGRYGRYYRCVNHKKTGCTGTLSANDDGSPRGKPGDKSTRKARHQLVLLLESYTATEWSGEELGILLGIDFKGIGRLTKEQCEKAYAYLRMKKPVGRYAILASDYDPFAPESS